MPRLFQHSLHFHYALFPKKLRWLFVSHMIRGVAQQSIGLFVPLFLFSKAQSMPWLTESMMFGGLSQLQRGMVVICIFFLLVRLSVVFLLIPATRLMKRLGLVRSMILGNVCSMVYYLLLYAADQHPSVLLFAAVVDALVVMLYWIAFYTEFSVQADIRKIGQEVGGLSFLDRLMRAGMPMIGGAATVIFGFGATYLTAAVLFFFSSAALLLVDDVKFSYEVSFKDFVRWLRKKGSVTLSLGFVGRFIDDAAILVWPVFLFLFLGSIDRVGYVYSIVLFMSLIISYFVGWYLGRHRGTMLFKLSTICMSMMWFFRSFIGQVWHLLFIDTVDRLATTIYIPIFDTLFLRRSRGKFVFDFHAYRELVISIVAPFFWLTVIVMFLLPVQWTGLFMLTGIGVLLSLFIRNGSRV